MKEENKKPDSIQHAEPMHMGKKINVKIILALAALLVVIGGLLFYQQVVKPKQAKTVLIKQQVLVRRSKDMGVIARGLTGKAVDVNTGKIVKAARIFSLDDKTVYLQLDLLSAPRGTVLDYIRYKDGRYVDHGELTIGKNDIKNVLFNWTINAGLAKVTQGKWKVATYANGILSKRIAYTITSNKVGYVDPQTTITPNDPEYNLRTALLVSVKK